MIRIIYSPNLLSPAKGRTELEIDDPIGLPLSHYLDMLELEIGHEIPGDFLIYNGPLIINLDTQNPVINDGAVIAVVAEPAKAAAILPTVIALITKASIGQALFSSLANTVLGFVTNALFGTKPKKPEKIQPRNSFDIGASTNDIDRYGPLQVVLGVHKFFPKQSAKPYVLYESDTKAVVTSSRFIYEIDAKEAYLRQVFNFGFVHLDETAIDANLKIGETDFAAYSSATMTYNTGTESAALTPFPVNTYTVEGAIVFDGRLKPQRQGVATSGNAGPFIIRSTPEGVNAVTVIVTFSYVASESDRTQVGGCFPQLLLEWRDYGENPGDDAEINWNLILDEFYTEVQTVGDYADQYFKTDGQLRRLTYRVDFSSNPGRYTFRAGVYLRPDTQTNSLQYTLESLTVHASDDSDYIGQKIGYNIIKATGQLNGPIDRLSTIGKSVFPVWNGSTWADAITSNPAWIWYAVAQGYKDTNGRVLFGAGLDVADIDTDTIKAWGLWCDAQSPVLKFNHVYQDPTNPAQVLEDIARCGRASTVFDSQLSVVYDQASLSPVQVFGVPNTIPDSYQSEFIMEELNDRIIINFNNEDFDYQPDFVTVDMPGVSTPTRPQELTIVGITNKDQAGAEANLIAAAQLYRRETHTWSVDAKEGLLCSRGDVVVLTNDLLQSGWSGRLVSGTTTAFTLDRAVPIQTGAGNYLMIRSPNGTIETQALNDTTTESTTSVTALSDFKFNPSTDTDSNPLDYVWVFGRSDPPGDRVKIIDIKTGKEKYTLTGVIENSSYYSAASGSYTHTVQTHNQLLPGVANLAIRLEPQDRYMSLLVTWRLINTDRADVRYRVGNEGYNSFSTVVGQSTRIDVPYNKTVEVEVSTNESRNLRDANSVQTATVTTTISKDSLTNPVTKPTGLELKGQGNNTVFMGKDAKFSWRGNSLNGVGFDPNFQDFYIYIKSAGVVVREESVGIATEYTYSHDKNVDDGGPFRSFSFGLQKRNRFGNVSEIVWLAVSNPQPKTITDLNISPRVYDAVVSYTRPTDNDFRGVKIHAHTSGSFAADDTNLVYEGISEKTTIPGLTPNTTYYFKIAPFDDYDKNSLTYSDEVTATTLQVGTSDIESGAVVVSVEGLTAGAKTIPASTEPPPADWANLCTCDSFTTSGNTIFLHFSCTMTISTAADSLVHFRIIPNVNGSDGAAIYNTGNMFLNSTGIETFSAVHTTGYTNGDVLTFTLQAQKVGGTSGITAANNTILVMEVRV